MHVRPTHRTIRNTATTAAAALLTFRIADVAVLPIPEHVSACLLPFFVAAVLTAAWGGYQVRVQRLRDERDQAELRAQTAELEAARLRRTERQQQESEDKEWASWWAEAREHDTIAFGKAVVSLDAHRHVQQSQAAG